MAAILTASLVVVDEIDIVCVAFLKPEYDPPVAGYRNAPKPSLVALERMQSVPRQIDIARFACSI